MLIKNISLSNTMRPNPLTLQYATRFGHSSRLNLGRLRYLFSSSNLSMFSGTGCDDSGKTIEIILVSSGAPINVGKALTCAASYFAL